MDSNFLAETVSVYYNIYGSGSSAAFDSGQHLRRLQHNKERIAAAKET